MYIKRICLFFLISLFFASCTITGIRKPYSLIPADYSFNIQGNTVLTGNVTSIIEMKKSNSHDLLPQTSISTIGQVYRYGFIHTSSILFFVKLKNQHQGKIRYWLPEYKEKYKWEGMIRVGDDIQNVIMEFEAYGTENGDEKQFILKKASCMGVELTIEDPLDVFLTEDNFPCLIGHINIEGSEYSLFAVLDNWPEKTAWENEVVFNPLQKFQCLDSNNLVAAELIKDRYTIYDNVPEVQRNTFQYAIALFAAYRHSMTVLKDMKNGWDLPRKYRDVFPDENK